MDNIKCIGVSGRPTQHPACLVCFSRVLSNGETLASGSATFDRMMGNQLTVNQRPAKLMTNWNSFNIGSAGKVVFAQPSVTSIALNLITSATEIFAQFSVNGQVAIVSPNGIVFGAGSQVSASSVIGYVLRDGNDGNNYNIIEQPKH